MMTLDSPHRPATAPLPAPTARPIPPQPALRRILLATARREASPALPYAIALLLLAAAGIGYGLYIPPDVLFISSNLGVNVLLSPAAHIAATVFFALAGISFGARQGFENRSLDAWTLLIHRPASRLSLFLGRTLAGLTLYAATAALTLAALWLVGRTHYAGEFFHWRFLLAAIADAFAGIAWYFAAMAAAERHARWWGSRIIPIGPALLATLMVVNAATFPHALLAAAPLILLSALAAYATFASHGFTLPRAISRTARAALACSLLLGFSLLSLLALTWARRDTADVSSLMATRLSLPLRSDYTTVRPDGAFDHQVITRNAAGRITDVTGVLSASPLWRATPFAPYIPPYRSPYAVDVQGRRINDLLYEKWYWVQGANRFYGRRGINGPAIGTIGRNGFVAPGATAQPFDGEVFDAYSEQWSTTAARSVYAVSLKDHAVHTLATSTAQNPIESAGHWYSNDTPHQSAVAIATARTLTAYADDGRLLQSFPLAHDPLASRLQVYYISPARHYAFLYHLADTLQLDTFDAAGKILSSRSAPAHTEIPGPPAVMPPAAIAYLHKADMLAGLLDAAENPLALAAARQLLPYAADRYPLTTCLAPPRPDTTPDNLHIPSWRLPTTLAALILLALLTLPLARRRAPKSWPLWLLATLLFGLPAPLTLLAARSKVLSAKD